MRGQTDRNCCLVPILPLNVSREWQNKMYSRSEMLDLVMVDGKAGYHYRDLVTGKVESSQCTRRIALHRWLWQRILPLNRTQKDQT